MGPNLLGVTQRRERDWLTRWIVEPDVMLAEEDPIATALFAQYKNVPMPNFRLNEHEAELLLGHIEEESQRVRETALAAAAAGEEARLIFCFSST